MLSSKLQKSAILVCQSPRRVGSREFNAVSGMLVMEEQLTMHARSHCLDQGSQLAPWLILITANKTQIRGPLFR